MILNNLYRKRDTEENKFPCMVNFSHTIRKFPTSIQFRLRTIANIFYLLYSIPFKTDFK